MVIIPVLRKLRQEDLDLEVSLSYIVRPSISLIIIVSYWNTTSVPKYHAYGIQYKTQLM
jgi:hypothetical protein